MTSSKLFALATAAFFVSSTDSTLSAQTLTSNSDAVSLTTGTAQTLTLSGAGISFDTRNYIVLGSASGTTPPTNAGPLQLPLVLDGYLLFTLGGMSTALLPTAVGAVNIVGAATTTFQFPADIPSLYGCLLYTSPSPRDRTRSRMPSSA